MAHLRVACQLVALAFASRVFALSPDWTGHLPHAGAVVHAGAARFTVLHAHIIRCEFVDNRYPTVGTFDDRPTISIQNRRAFPVPWFDVVNTSGSSGPGITLTTSALELRWTGGPFTSTSLTISLRVYPFSVWNPGSAPSGNLHGTIRTLDRVGEPLDLKCKQGLRPTTQQLVMEFYAHCEEGLASKDGWVLLDDSLRPRIQLSRPAQGSVDPSEGRHVMDGWPWPVSPPSSNAAAWQAGPNPGPYTDWYFFGFGLNHMGAVSAFTALSGPIPLLPAYSLGAGFSRWYAYGQLEETEGVAGPGGQGGLMPAFEAWGIPLDMLSIDMDWHTVGPRGQRNNPVTGDKSDGWTGWTWEKTLFPVPRAIMAAAARRGVHVNLNQHPAEGVAWDESAYVATATAMGIDPRSSATVEFDPADQRYVAALLQNVLGPLDATGLDFWWQDFQHGPFSTVTALNPTYLTNLYLWENPWRYGPLTAERRMPGAQPEVSPALSPYVDRPFLFGRWSGYGGHRMPIGFAGDTAVKWRVLRYESYFDATASNVAFMWSNDIGGFEGAPPPELMVRWSQWGALSASLRGHSSKTSPPRTAWSFPHPYFGAIRQAWRLRAALGPYLRSAQRDSHETGLQLMQPMYWHFPGAASAYSTQAQHQYFLGPGRAVWAAPVAAPRVDDGSEGGAEAGLSLNARFEMDRMEAQGGPSKVRRAPFSAATSQHHGRVPWTVWVPPGTWIEWGSWAAVRGDATPSDAASGAPAGRGLPASYNTGQGSFLSRNYSLTEIPMFSPPGAIIVQRVLPGTGSAARGAEHPGSVLGLASHPLTDLALWIMPLAPPADSAPVSEGARYGPLPLPECGWAGGASGTMGSSAGRLTSRARLYEDDGITQAAADGWYADSHVDCEWERGPVGGSGSILDGIGRMLWHTEGGEAADTLTCSISEPTGKGYPGHPSSRVLSWRFIGVWPPSSIEVDGVLVTDRDTAGAPDNGGEHGAWTAGRTSWAYHGPSASAWVHVATPVPTRGTHASVGSDGRASTGDGSLPVHTVKLRFEPGARLDDPILTRFGTHRLVSRSLTCKEEVDRTYGVLYPSDIPSVLNVSAGAVLLSEATSAGQARSILERMIVDTAAGLEGVQGWGIPTGQRTMQTVQAHCLGALYDGLAIPKPLDASDSRAVAAARPLSFAGGVSSSKGSAPGMVSQHEDGALQEDDWEGKGWKLMEGGKALPPT